MSLPPCLLSHPLSNLQTSANSMSLNATYPMRAQPGFSLIELLVVLVIVAVIAAGVSLAINPLGSSAKQINQQGDRLYAQMQYALDEALVRNRALGLVIEQTENDTQLSTRYSWKRDDGKDPDTNDRIWTQTANTRDSDNPLSPNELQAGLTWDINVEESSLEDSLDQLLKEEDEALSPSIIFSPSGEVTEFTLTISLSETALGTDADAINERYKIALNERGELVRYPVGVADQ